MWGSEVCLAVFGVDSELYLLLSSQVNYDGCDAFFDAQSKEGSVELPDVTIHKKAQKSLENSFD